VAAHIPEHTHRVVQHVQPRLPGLAGLTHGNNNNIRRFAVIIISHMHSATAGREQAGVCHIHGVGAGFLQIRIQQHDLLAHAAKGQSHGAVRTYMPGADDHNFSLIHNAHLEQILYLLYSPPGHL